MATPRARPVQPDLRALDCAVSKRARALCSRKMHPVSGIYLNAVTLEFRNPEVCLTRQSFILTAILKHDKARAIGLRFVMAAFPSPPVDFFWLGAWGKYFARLFCFRQILLK